MARRAKRKQRRLLRKERLKHTCYKVGVKVPKDPKLFRFVSARTCPSVLLPKEKFVSMDTQTFVSYKRKRGCGLVGKICHLLRTYGEINSNRIMYLITRFRESDTFTMVNKIGNQLFHKLRKYLAFRTTPFGHEPLHGSKIHPITGGTQLEKATNPYNVW